MTSHAPPGYDCPFCAIAAGRPEDEAFVIYRDATVLVVVSRHWRPKNPGHVLVVPVDHYENIYVLPDAASERIHRLAQRVSVALNQVYGCDGISLRQNNEPAGGQDVWHYHLHVIPRWANDGLHSTPLQLAPDRDRRRCGAVLREYFAAHPPNLG